MAKSKSPKRVETLTHADAKRTNIPTVEHQAVMSPEDQAPATLRYFHTYLQALTLVMRATADRPRAARRALERIERIHARLTEPGR